MPKKTQRYQSTLIAILSVSLMASVGTLLAQQAEPTPVNPVVNGITQAVVQQGALNCAARVNQVTNFVGFTQQGGSMLMMPGTQPDQRILPIAMEVPVNGGSAYISATFAPNQANGCGATYDAVVYWPDKCDVVTSKQFAVFKKIGLLKKEITVLDGGPTTKVFLMQAGKGCLSIKKEVVL